MRRSMIAALLVAAAAGCERSVDGTEEKPRHLVYANFNIPGDDIELYSAYVFAGGLDSHGDPQGPPAYVVVAYGDGHVPGRSLNIDVGSQAVDHEKSDVPIPNGDKVFVLDAQGRLHDASIDPADWWRVSQAAFDAVPKPQRRPATAPTQWPEWDRFYAFLKAHPRHVAESPTGTPSTDGAPVEPHGK